MESLDMLATHMVKILEALSETGLPEIPVADLPRVIIDTATFFITRVLPLYIASIFLT